MRFETAGIEVAFWIPPLVAFVISFFTSMGGVSGALLLSPFQMSALCCNNPSVSATNQVFNSRHPQRSLSLPAGRPHGLAADVDRGGGRPAGRIHRGSRACGLAYLPDPTYCRLKVNIASS